MAKKISQSDTRWVKKAGQRGYVEQISTGKRVTGKVRLVTDTTKGTAGQTRTYSKGRDVTGSKSNKATQAPATSAGRAWTSDSAKTPEVTKLPGGMTRKQASQFVSFKAGTEGRRSGSSATPSSAAPAGISSSANFSKGPKTKSAELRKRQAAKTRTVRTQQKRAAERQSGVRTALGLSNPLTAQVTLSAIFGPKISRAGKSAAKSAKNWWEGK